VWAKKRSHRHLSAAISVLDRHYSRSHGIYHVGHLGVRNQPKKKTHTSPWLETTLILDNPWFCAVLSLPIPKKIWTNRVSILKIGIGINNLEPSSPAQFHSGKHHSGICLKSWWLIANIAEACDPDTQNLASIWFSQSVASFTKQSAKLHPMLRQNLSIAIWAL